MQRKGTAVWIGALKEGNGMVSTESGALDELPYSFATRFESQKGTNPEELIAGAHAACFSMALSAELGKSGFKPESIETTATLTFDKDAQGGFSVTKIKLTTRGNVPAASKQIFQEAADRAKHNCPVSRLLKAPITLEAVLEEGEESLSA